jgi:hypothetical protein
VEKKMNAPLEKSLLETLGLMARVLPFAEGATL